MSERKNAVTFAGNPLTIKGNELKVGDKAPAFTVMSPKLDEETIKDFSGIVVIASVPSLDTEVCSKETKTFHKKMKELSGVRFFTVSMDLPFAQARWTSANEIEDLEIYSDHKDADFAEKYGVWIKELRLLSRVVFVIQDGEVKYIQVVKEIANEPDYDKVVDKVKELQ
jgi:thiol peroxidase